MGNIGPRLYMTVDFLIQEQSRFRLVFVCFYLFLLTACDSRNPLDKEPAGDSTQNAETTETPEIIPPVEPTASPTASPTPEPTKPVELLPVEKLDLSIEGDFCEEKLDEALRGYKDTGEYVTVAVSFGDVPPEDAAYGYKIFFDGIKRGEYQLHNH